MPKVLINDAVHPICEKILIETGFDVNSNKIDQEDLMQKLPEYDAICVRSATKVRKELIDACPNLKVIGRGGVGLDNIDVEHAKSKGIKVVNTPNASTRSVSELVFAHLFSIARFIFKASREMPESGHDSFKKLKKIYSKGFDLEGKTIGIIGIGRIGQETAKIAYGLGMNVMAVDTYIDQVELDFNIAQHAFKVDLKTSDMEKMLAEADVITLHVPSTDKAILDAESFKKMKDGVIIINASRGGTIDEKALLEAINSDKVAYAGLDVFENEPTPNSDILKHEKIISTPHIGGSTEEAQQKIGIELAKQIIDHLS